MINKFLETFIEAIHEKKLIVIKFAARDYVQSLRKILSSLTNSAVTAYTPLGNEIIEYKILMNSK